MDPVIWPWIQLFPPDTRAYTPREQPYYSFKLQYCTCYDTLYSMYSMRIWAKTAHLNTYCTIIFIVANLEDKG